jgi:hypothetical protein
MEKMSPETSSKLEENVKLTINELAWDLDTGMRPFFLFDMFVRNQ